MKEAYMIAKRNDILSAIKAYMSQINLQHGTTTVENRKTTKYKDYRVKTDMLRSIGKQSGESVESVRTPEEEKVGYSGKDLRKRKVLSLEWKSEGVMDDESGELMELVEEVPLKELGDAKVERLVCG